MQTRMGLFAKGATAAAMVGGLGIAAGIGFAVKSAADFESSLNTFQAVSSATGSQMRKVGSLAKQLGKDVTLPATSAKDAADAMTELAKGGLSVKDSMTAAKGVLQMSAAAQISNAEAATITARALNSFGLEGGKATHVADLLAAAANASTAEMSDLALGMQASSAVFKQGGQTIEELTTELAQMSNAGIAGSDAGTSLKTMMLSLMAPSKQAADRMHELGLNVRDGHGAMLPMSQVIPMFAAKLGKLSDAQRDAALKTIFGTDAIRAANVILMGGKKAHDDMAKAVNKNGAAADMAKAKMKGFNGSVEAFKSNVETLAITLGGPLLKGATNAMKALSSVVDYADKIAQTKGFHMKFQVALAGVEKIARMAVEMAGKFRDALQRAFAAIDWDATGAAVIAGIAAALKGAANLGKALAATVGDALSAIRWEAVGVKVGPGLASALVVAFATLLDPSFWLRHWHEMLAIALAVFPVGRLAAFGEKLAAPLLRSLAPLGAKLGAALGLVLKAGGDAALQVAERLGPRLGGVFLSTVTRAAEMFRQLPGKIVAALGEMIDAAVRRLGPFKTLLLKAFAWDAVIRSVVQAVAGIGQAIASGASAIYSAATSLASRVLHAIVDGLKSLVPDVNAKLLLLPAAVLGIVPAVIAAGVQIGANLTSGVLSGLGDLASSVAAKVKSGIEGAVHAAGKLLHGSGEFMFTKHVAGKPMAQGVIEGFMLGLNELPSKMNDKLRSSLEAAKQVVDGARSTFGNAMGRLADDGVKVFEAKTSKMLDQLAAKFDRMKSRVDKSLSGKLAGIDAWENQLTGAEAALKALGDAHDAAALDRDEADARKGLAKAQAGGDADEIAQAQQTLDEALYAKKRAALEAQASLERADRAKQADERRAAAQAEADAEKARLDAKLERERINLQARRDLDERHLTDRLAALQTFLDKHPAMWTKANDALMKVLNSFGVNFKTTGKYLGNAFVKGLHEDMDGLKQSGVKLGQAFAAGLRSTADDVREAAKAVAAAAEGPLRLHSPAKEGPLSSLDTWWKAFTPTLLGGMDTGGIGRAVSSALAPPAAGAGFGLALAGGGSARGVTVVEKHVHLHGGTFFGTDELQAGRDLKRLIDQAG